MSDDTPTQRFDTPAPAAPPEKKRNRLVPIVIIVGVILIAAIVVLIFVLLNRGGTAQTSALSTDTPTPTTTSAPPPAVTPTPTPTHTQTHTNAPPPPPTGTSIQYFLIDNSTHPVIYCNTQSPNPTTINITFKWSTFKVTGVYLGVDTADATEGALFENLPSTGTQADFPAGYNPYSYPCPSASQEFTLTVTGDNGVKVSRMITVLNKGDHS